jgi:WD40 repeat protein
MPRGERPLDAGDGALLRFAADLRRLRKKVGTPTYRELARRVHYSVTTLSSAADGRKLPSLAVTLAFVRACGGDADEWERRWHAVATELAVEEAANARKPGAPGYEQPPYVGLAAFQPVDADWFFGRERMVEELVTRLSVRRFVAVFGASGAGKSSLLRAGLLPRWRAEQRPVVLLAPGPHPLEKCAVELACFTGGTPGQLRADLAEDRRNLHRIVSQTLAERPGEAELLLVVDQFEEAFTLCHDQNERSRFINALITAAQAQNSRCRVVLGVRADFYVHCTTQPELLDALADGQVGLGPMTTEELRQAITNPAVRAGCSVESALLADLMAYAGGRVGVLPLLSHALLETWRRRRGNRLTLAGFQAAGGIEGALAHTAESLYTSMSPAQQRWTKDLFLRLTALGEGTEDTKRRISRGELDTADPEIASVLERLASKRLLILDRDSVEITHEALIRCLPRLHGWLTDDREGLRIHRQLTEAAETWESLKRDPGALYRGTRLAVTHDRFGAGDVTLNNREREFLDASLSAQAADQTAVRRRSRRLRQLVALLTVLLVLATAATVHAFRAERTANEQRDIAISQKVAGQATKVRANNPALGAQLSLAAYRLNPTVEARGSLLSTFATPYATQLIGHDSNVNVVAYSNDGHIVATASADHAVRLWNVTDRHRPVGLATITAHTDNVNAIALSHDGRILATGSWDDSVRLWDISDPRHPGELAVIMGHTDNVNAVAFSPNGYILATTSNDRTVRLWDVTDPHQPGKLSTLEHTGNVVSVAFSDDGRSVATGSWDHIAQLWDITDPGRPGEPRTLTGHTGPVAGVAFSRDGHTLATASQDRTVRLWDADNGSVVATLTDHADGVRAVMFSPDGRILTTAGLDRTVRLWDVTDPSRPVKLTVLTGPSSPVVSVAFSPDGRTLATANDDRTTWLWDLPGPLLAGHTDSVCAVAFSPNGRILATGSWDSTVRLWDVSISDNPREMAVLTAHRGSVCGAMFSPDGRILATASYDHTARLWDVTDPHQPDGLATLSGHTKNVNAVAFSPDGQTLVTASLDGSAGLWDVTDPRNPIAPRTFLKHTASRNNGVNSVAFSPDGNTVATASWDRTVRLWTVSDPQHPRELAVLTAHTDGVSSVAFSRDGHTLATASWDRTIRLWNVTRPQHPGEPRILVRHTDSVHSVDFSSDGQTLAAATFDRSVRLWNVGNPYVPSDLGVLSGHTDGVYFVVFSPQGQTLATASRDHTARLWRTDVESVAARICDVAYPTITRAEWGQYFPDLSYQPPCAGYRS